MYDTSAAALSPIASRILAERFYTDTAADTPSAMAPALETYGRGRVLFTTDYPWRPRGDMLAALGRLGDRDLARAIVGRNAVPGLVRAGAAP